MNNKCFINNCTTTRSEDITLFRATRKSGRLEKWKNALPPQHGELTEDSYICELHFESKCVPRYVELRFIDGFNQFQKTQVGLMKGASPTIFDKEAVEKKRCEIFTSNLLRNKPQIALVLAQDENNSSKIENPVVPSVSTESVFRNIENVPVFPCVKSHSTIEPVLINKPEPICIDLTLFDFDTLKLEIGTFQLPFMWSYSVYRNLTVILINWDLTFSDVIKEIIITPSLDCQVFVNKVLITIESLPALKDMHSLKRIIEIVDLLPITKFDLIHRKLNLNPSILPYICEAYRNKAKEKTNKQRVTYFR